MGTSSLLGRTIFNKSEALFDIKIYASDKSISFCLIIEIYSAKKTKCPILVFELTEKDLRFEYKVQSIEYKVQRWIKE